MSIVLLVYNVDVKQEVGNDQHSRIKSVVYPIGTQTRIDMDTTA